MRTLHMRRRTPNVDVPTLYSIDTQDQDPIPPWPAVPDYSPSGYDGLAINMEPEDVQTDAPGLKYVQFGGSQYVNMGNVLGFERTDPFSIAFWIKTTVSGQTFAMAKWNSSGYIVYIADSKIGLSLRDGSGELRVMMDDTTVWRDGTWHHFTLTYDGTSSPSGVLFYLDGAPVAKTTILDSLTSSILVATTLNVGGSPSGGLYLTGSMDEVAIWDKVLSPSEASAVYAGGALPVNLLALGSAANLVGWWPMGDGDAYPTLKDRSVGGHNGTMVSMSPSDIRDRGVVPSSAYSKKSVLFDGSNEYVTMGNVLGFERTNAFSLCAWFKTTDLVGLIVGKKNVSRGYSLYVSNSHSLYFELRSGDTNKIEINTTLAFADGQWHHVCVTYNGSSLASGTKIYVDGALASVVASMNNLTQTTVTTNEFQIGQFDAGGSPGWALAGNIDDVSVWDKELSLAEVVEVYNLGLPTNLMSLTTAANLVGWWKMGD